MKSKDLLFIFIILLMCNACTKSKDADSSCWENSTLINTINSYKDYLNKFPNGKFKNEADSTIQVLVWKNVNAANSFESYESYLKEYPNGFFKQLADSLFEDALWKSANKTSDMSLYVKYKTAILNGKHIGVVQNHLDKYLIENGHAGFFRVGTPLRLGHYKGFNISITHEKCFNVFASAEIDVIRYFVSEKNKKMLELNVDDNNIIVEILILSDKFRTKNNISVNSLISIFSKKYPEYIVNQNIISTNENERECIYLCAKGERGIQFEVNGNDVISEDGCSFYKLKDETGNSKIAGVRISKSDDDEYDSSFKNRENEKAQNEIANQEEAQRNRNEKSRSSNNLPNWLSGTTWKLHDSNGDFLLGVRFIDKNYLRFEMYGFNSERCEYSIPANPNSNVNLIAFTYRGKYLELYYDNSNHILETTTGARLKKEL